MIKILFFDIDGTLLELGKKEMHQELIIALNEVKAKPPVSFNYRYD